MAPLYAGFAATGVGVALPGAVLPVLATHWRMNDAVSGRLFLLAWIGSSLGALLVRGSLRLTLALGSCAVALAAACLGWTNGQYAGVWMLLYGCGLGAAMTAISLIRQQQASDVGTEFVRLNFVWAVGAVAAPSLAGSALAGGSVRPVFWSLAIVFGLLAVWSVSLPTLRLERPQVNSDARPWTVFHAVPPGLILMVALATGIEASAGGWLATYARRDGHGLAETIAAPACLWAGLLASRMFWSVFPKWRQADVIVRGSALLMACSVALLLAGDHGGSILLAAFGLGFGLGPTYPMLLAWALRFHRGGAIFFLAGVGSSCLPWLTGVLSNALGSLRAGLAVPCAGAVLMLLLAWLLPLPRWQREAAVQQDSGGTGAPLQNSAVG